MWYVAFALPFAYALKLSAGWPLSSCFSLLEFPVPLSLFFILLIISRDAWSRSRGKGLKIFFFVTSVAGRTKARVLSGSYFRFVLYCILGSEMDRDRGGGIERDGVIITIATGREESDFFIFFGSLLFFFSVPLVIPIVFSFHCVRTFR